MLKIILHLLASLIRSRQSLALENFALRHQLYVLQRLRPRIRLKKRDRLLWVVLSRIWRDWRKPLTIGGSLFACGWNYWKGQDQHTLATPLFDHRKHINLEPDRGWKTRR